MHPEAPLRIGVLVSAALLLAACGADAGDDVSLTPTDAPEATTEPTPEPTDEPTPEPTVDPTAEATPEPTDAPTEDTVEPTDEPTAVATPPTPLPTLDPSEALREDAMEITGVLGTVDVEGGCTVLEGDDGERYEVLWPEGYRVEPGASELTGPDGEVAAAPGDELTVTGAVADDMASTCQVGIIFRAEDVTVG